MNTATLAKRACLLIGASCALSLAYALQDAEAKQAPIERLAWLEGSWQGTLGPSSIEEHWIPLAGGTMLGVGRTIRAERTAEFEFLRLEQRGEKLVYVAQPGGRPPTEFELTRLENGEAVFENPEHDFPTLVRYRRTDDEGLVASIEGQLGGKPARIDFVFRRAKRE